jgi:hypothetical protein
MAGPDGGTLGTIENYAHNSQLTSFRTNSPKWGHEKAQPLRLLQI